MEVGGIARPGGGGPSSGSGGGGGGGGGGGSSLSVISRHSSLVSLQNEHRPESASPSSFGDEDDEDMLDDSDVDIS